MKNILSGIITIAFLISAVPCRGAEIELTMNCYKDSFELSDQVILEVTWKNTGPEGIHVFVPEIHDGLNLRIIDESGSERRIFQTVEYKYDKVSKEAFRALEPGGKFSSVISATLELPYIYNYPYKTQEDSEDLYLFAMDDTACYVKPGKYEIQYRYINIINSYYDEKGEQRGVWTGNAESGTVTIEIK
ncbi:MAG: hypothetical protein ISS26_01045 [Candidatus Omnitrophica bacterium]|nr:hypothetical protein [Candidatus Omnitrophota bacterium]